MREIPASQALVQDPRQALPEVSLTSSLADDGVLWVAKRDLLDSGRMAPYFVVEIGDDGLGRIRFGDGTFGQRPLPGSEFSAQYRVGNGRAGNVGAEALRRIVTSLDAGIEQVRNPLAARHGSRDEGTGSPVRAASVSYAGACGHC